ncbi:phage regulatory CII family protein [Chitinasiproducens palmae]|uniref:Uncharacterized protein n=1 Tax=Chitinasiproducens palmae TaxID=1770053 RepID=A0A1H2PPJ8_9BURK|nr:phage regulatory CII family protein [Chitinasiproducens palmae]SDV48690.1 hypothetical protein SAMN05216551_105302 [Chitinasiproducens palmae]
MSAYLQPSAESKGGCFCTSHVGRPFVGVLPVHLTKRPAKVPRQQETAFTVTYLYHDINQHDALYNLARAYPGGVEALALRMGRSAHVLYNKLRPGIASHHVTFEEATEIAELCAEAGVEGAARHIDAMEARIGRVAVALPSIDGLSDKELTSCLYEVLAHLAAAARSIEASIADDQVIDDAEMSAIEKDFSRLRAGTQEWQARVRARHAADKKARVRAEQ